MASERGVPFALVFSNENLNLNLNLISAIDHWSSPHGRFPCPPVWAWPSLASRASLPVASQRIRRPDGVGDHVRSDLEGLVVDRLARRRRALRDAPQQSPGKVRQADLRQRDRQA